MDTKLTSVKILRELYRNFKVKTLDDEFTLQKLVNRSMDLYILDSKFKNKIKNYDRLIPSGSRLWKRRIGEMKIDLIKFMKF